MPKKKIRKVIPNELYHFDLLISFNETDESFAKWLEKKDLMISEDVLDIGGFSPKAGRTLLYRWERVILMRLNFFPKSTDDIAILQHEIFHIVDYVMTTVGIPLSDDTGEAFAYLTQYYTKKIYSLIGK